MKRYFAMLIGLCALIMLLLTGCNTTTTKVDDEPMFNQFITIEEQYNADYGYLCIVYDKNTKVMYYVWYTSYKGSICPIYNADGSVKIYGE